MPETPEISVVIPAHNESENLDTLRENLLAALEGIGKPFEIILVDDGSADGTFEKIAEFASEDDRFKGLRMRKNVGKANALAAGFEAALGEIVFTLDADNQDDPSEMPRFLEKLEAGYDLVSGWKKIRKDPSQRVFASRVFNGIIRAISGVHLHDFNCGYKVYRSEVIKSLNLYGEWHRFIPVLASEEGFRVGEIPVVHHPRVRGKSRYGWERYFRGFADCLTLLFLSRYAERPAHLFTGFGVILGVFGAIMGLYAVTQSAYPLLFLGVLSVILGANFFFTGLLAELFVARQPPKRFRTAICERVGFER
jgi:glycosyltransferase involved in cell wall biosynthesis